MATPAPAIDGSRPLYARTLADLADERLQLRIDIAAASRRELELKRENARLQELIDSASASRNIAGPRFKQPEMIRPASVAPATTADSLRSKLKTERDPKERFRIQKQLDALSS